MSSVDRCAIPSTLITRGIPLPPIPRGGRPRKYLIREMQPGDSFYIPRIDGKGDAPLRSVKTAIRSQTRSLPGSKRRFTFRQENNGWRCWRIA
jgi:hypothetical protein